MTSSSHLHAQHQQQRNVVTRTKEVFLAREASDGAGFGFILRGGHPTGGDATKLRPLVITYIRPNSPAERCSTPFLSASLSYLFFLSSGRYFCYLDAAEVVAGLSLTDVSAARQFLPGHSPSGARNVSKTRVRSP